MDLTPFLWILILALAFSAFVQGFVHHTFNRFASLQAASGIRAEPLARALLDQAGLAQVVISSTERLLDDRFDPQAKVLHISNPSARSISALAVTAHEVGHAIQHDQGYWALKLRQVVQPLGYLGASLSLLGVFVGWFLGVTPLGLGSGIGYVFSIVLLLFTLPVEVDANRRALAMLTQDGVIEGSTQLGAAKRVLFAAVLTYVAAALSPVIHGFFLLWSHR